MQRGILEASHRVLTPEYVEFDFALAGLSSRFLAWLIDTLVTIVLATVMVMTMVWVIAVLPGFGTAMTFVIWFLIDWGYAILLESIWSGQTIGKRAMKIRVVQESGVRIGFLQSALRNLARPLDRLPLFYLVGGVTALFSGSQQRLGDMLAGTIVIRDARRQLPAGLERAEQFGELSNDPVILQRISRVGAEEQELLFAAAIRREELTIEARLKLFAALARRLERALDLARPPHLSDEKFVLGLTAVLAWR
jgi:uncharacterized RDD family membrane protein YckC